MVTGKTSTIALVEGVLGALLLLVGLIALRALNSGVSPLVVLAGVVFLLAVPVTFALTRASRPAHLVIALIGSVLVAFGVYWYSQHSHEPEIFSPSLVGYLGAPLVIAGVVGAVFTRPASRSAIPRA